VRVFPNVILYVKFAVLEINYSAEVWAETPALWSLPPGNQFILEH
jgi:hypothetical protein